MRRVLICLLVAGSATLSGCAGMSLTDNIAAAAAAVQQATLGICQIVPTLESIDQLIKQGDPTLTTANAIANVICKTVTTVASSPSTPPAANATPRTARVAGRLYGAYRPAPIKIDGVTINFQ